MQVWLMRDPETERIALSDHPLDGDDFPRGKRGEAWEVRQTDISDSTFGQLTSGKISPRGQDYLHRNLWEAAPPTVATE